MLIGDKIAKYCNSGFKDVLLMEEIMRDFNQSTRAEQRKNYGLMYVVFRGDFDNLFQRGDYVGVINRYKVLCTHPQYSVELKNNRFKIQLMACKTYLMNYLERKDKTYFSQGKNMFKEIYMELIDSNSLYDEVKAMIKGIEEHNVITKVTLELPIAMRSLKKRLI
jgi:hypothetical protein